jgi:hypothetical protein
MNYTLPAVAPLGLDGSDPTLIIRETLGGVDDVYARRNGTAEARRPAHSKQD